MKRLLVVCLPVWLSVVAIAQSPALTPTTETPVAGFGHNYIQSLNETVDPSTGALSIRIEEPVPHERGVNMPEEVLVYDTAGQPQSAIVPHWVSCFNVQGIDQSNCPAHVRLGGTGTIYPDIWLPDITTYYLGQYMGANNSISFDKLVKTVNGSANQPPGVTVQYICRYYTNFVYTDPSGGKHGLDLTWFDSSVASDCAVAGIEEYLQGGDEQYRAVLDPANGGSAGPGFSFKEIYVSDTHGNVYFPGVEDTNGNGGNGPILCFTCGVQSASIGQPNGNGASGTGRDYSIGASTVGNWTLPTGSNVPGVGYSIAYQSVVPTMQLAFTPANRGLADYNDLFCAAATATDWNGYAVEVPSSVGLPNGQQYTFGADPVSGYINKITYPTGATVTYTWANQPASQASTFITMGLPADGVAQCLYKNDWMSITKRVTNIGGVDTQEQDFTYATTWASDGSNSWTQKTTTVVTKDLVRPGTPSFQTVYTYLPERHNNQQTVQNVELQPAQLAEHTIQYYDTNNTLVHTVTKTWFAPDLLLGECDTLAGGSTSGTFYQYQRGPIGPDDTAVWTDLKTDVAEYGYGQGVTSTCVRPTSLAPRRETITAYHVFPATIIFPGLASILDRPDSVIVYGDGVKMEETDYGYDETTPVPAIALNHDDHNFSSGSTLPRGNVTSVTKKCFQGSVNCTDSITKSTYDTTGQVLSVQDTDPLHSPTIFYYDDSYTTDDGSPTGNTNTYVTTVIRPPTYGASHVSTYKYDFNKGKVHQSTDENGQVSTYYYNDPSGRLTEADLPLSGQAYITYNDAGPNPTVTTTQVVNASDDEKVSTVVMDGFGHTIQTQLNSDPSGTDYVDTVYDGMGLPYTTSNPYRTPLDLTYGLTYYYYDSLGRPIKQVHPDGNSLQWCYDGLADYGQNICSFNLSSTSAGSWVDYSDESGIRWQGVSDAFGNLVAVMEPNGVQAAGTVPTNETDYQYDPIGNLLQVDQWGGAPGGTGDRRRVFTYDSLSRLQKSQNPESGQISYGYLTNGALCAGDPTLPCSKTDGNGVITTYVYDVLNRLTSKSSPIPGPGLPPAMMSSCYQYDGASAQNLVGRLVNEWTQKGSCPTVLPTQGVLTQESVIAYDSMGRVTQSKQCVLTFCTPTLVQAYNYIGNPTQWTDGLNGITFTEKYDKVGRPLSLTSTWADSVDPVTLFSVPDDVSGSSTPGYSPAGGLQNWMLGTNLNLNRGYDKRMRVTSQTVTHP